MIFSNFLPPLEVFMLLAVYQCVMKIHWYTFTTWYEGKSWINFHIIYIDIFDKLHNDHQCMKAFVIDNFFSKSSKVAFLQKQFECFFEFQQTTEQPLSSVELSKSRFI